MSDADESFTLTVVFSTCIPMNMFLPLELVCAGQ